MSFVGKLQDSDALYFRALVAKSFFNDIEIVGHCKSESNRLMTSALEAFGTGGWIDFGDSEEVLCFSAIRSSREPGEYTFVGNADLLDYVKDDLLRLLSQLGCDIEIEGNTLKIYSSGWKVQGDAIHLPFNKSDIMASAFLLSSWGYSHKLFLSLNIERKSPGFAKLKMTLELLKTLGFGFRYQQVLKESGGKKIEIVVPANQKPQISSYPLETDLSLAFALACTALVSDPIKIISFPLKSIQPESIFLEILEEMGANFDLTDHFLAIHPTQKLKGTVVDLAECIDLFPSLAILCALAETPSDLMGLYDLSYRKVSRVQKIEELLQRSGARIERETDRLKILSPVSNFSHEFDFDCEGDPRLAMAAAILLKKEIPVNIKNRQIVNKSFPDFWDILNV